MANPITAIASRSCAKNSLLKQTGTPKEDDLSSGSSTTQVSTTSDIPIATASGSDIYGSQTDTTVTTPGSEGSTTYATENISEATGGPQATDMDAYFKGLYKRFGNNVTTQELIDKKFISADKAADYDKATGGQNLGVATVTPGTPGGSDTDSEATPEYEDTQGMNTFDIRKDFRRQKIAERLSGKSEKQAKRYAKRAERLTKRGKTEKANIFAQYEVDDQGNKKLVGGKAGNAAQRAENLRDRLKQFKIQQDQGGSGRSSYQTTKVRENLDAAKERLKDNSTTFTGNDPTDFQQVGKNVAKIAKDVKEKGLGAAQDVGDFVGNILGRKKPLTGVALKTGPLKRNYFNK